MDRSDEAFQLPQFRVEVQRVGTRNRLVLAGRIGWDATAQILECARRLAEDRAGVDIDWHEAETLTGSCLQTLVALSVKLAEQGETLRVVNDSPPVRRLLELGGLSERFPGVQGLA